MLLDRFESKFIEVATEILWSQWSALGVRGGGASRTQVVVDPEALVLLTWGPGRADARLFDTAMAWVREHSDWLDLKRLAQMGEDAPQQVQGLGSAWASYLSESGESVWAGLIDEELVLESPRSVFVETSGEIVEPFEPVFAAAGWRRGEVSLQSGAMGHTDTSEPSVARLLLRKLVGTNARAEVLVAVLFGDGTETGEIADAAGYSRRSVQLILRDFEDVELVTSSRQQGRAGKAFPSLKCRSMTDALFGDQWEQVRWINMKAVALSLVELWQVLRDVRERELGAYPAESLLRDAVLAAHSRLGATASPRIPRLEPGRQGLDSIVQQAESLVDALAKGLVK